MDAHFSRAALGLSLKGVKTMSSVSGESRTCVDCDYAGDSTTSECSRCGGSMVRASTFRRRGWFLIMMGLLLTIGMGVLIINEAIKVYRSSEPGAEVTYTRGTGMMIFGFGFMGFFFSFGVTAIANGIWLIRYGKPNPKLKAIMFALFSLFMTVGVIVSFFR
jgi:hypothetical protein